MVQYYWNPNFQQPKMQNPNMQQMQPMQPMQPMQQPMVPPPVSMPSGTIPAGLPMGEQSYIENILRLNIGEPGTFHFSFAHTVGEALNVRNITGYVEAAGRDHVIIHEASTDHQFLFPMIYFDYAEFEGQVKYFPQTVQPRQV
ncbi:spore coat protein GerQ [Sporosarcina sp. Marseille-Q4063]|uniref:spore coat protein GerQ n=1 Tax=Sporosarcina sp. Marseille-Q4063 TaxID=2810514 RepID=UPI001BB09C7C|nr:spore coat protein GerQ [Sporosarcina sp. Marseille-Q4063]QUW21108.1 spore coat protein GerQ [Sporosarcina sp. Marseille-Q4063]